MAVLGHDKFTESSDTPLENHTPTNVGTSWSTTAPSDADHYDITASTDEVSVDAVSKYFAFLSDQSGGKVTEVRVTGQTTGTGNNRRIEAVAATLSGGNAYGYFTRLDVPNGDLELRRFTGTGVGDTFMGKSTPGLSDDTEYTLVLELSDNGTDVTVTCRVLNSSGTEVGSHEETDSAPGTNYVNRDQAGFLAFRRVTTISDFIAYDDQDYEVSPATLSISGDGATQLGELPLSSSPATLTISGGTPDLALGESSYDASPAQLSLTGETPNVDFSEKLDSEVSAGSLSISGVAATFDFPLNANASLGLLRIASDKASVISPSIQEQNLPDYESVILNDVPLAYWRLGESSGTTAADSSGNGNDGVYENSPTLGVPGALLTDSDTAVTFAQASSQYISSSYAGVTGSGARSIEAWVKTTDTRFFDGGCIISWGTWLSGQAFLLHIPDQEIRLVVLDGNVIWSAPNINDGNWHHVVVTLPGNADVTDATCYVDGVAQSVSSSAPQTINTGTSLNVAIGHDNVDPSFTRYFDGSLDDVALYGHVLTQDQVSAHYEAGLYYYAATPGALSVVGSDISFSFTGVEYTAAPGSIALTGVAGTTTINPSFEVTGDIGLSFVGGTPDFTTPYSRFDVPPGQINLFGAGEFADILLSEVFEGTAGTLSISSSAADITLGSDYAVEILSDDPELYFRLGEPSGTTAVDSSGNSRDGTYQNTPTLGATSLVASDQGNNAVSFASASSEHITTTYSGVTGTAARSFEAWIQTTAATGDIAAILSYGGTSANGAKVVWGVKDGNPIIDFSNSVIEWADTVNDGEPHHLVLTIPSGGSTSDCRCYVDGTENTDSTVFTDTTINTDSDANVAVGFDGASVSTGRYWEGTLDEVAIYSVELSATQAFDHWDAGVFYYESTPATLAFTGGDAVVDQSGVIGYDVAAGTITLSGVAGDYVGTTLGDREYEAAPSTLKLVGAVQTIGYPHRYTIAPATLSLTGGSIDFSFSELEAQVTAGTLKITGGAATLGIPVDFAVEPGSIRLTGFAANIDPTVFSAEQGSLSIVTDTPDVDFFFGLVGETVIATRHAPVSKRSEEHRRELAVILNRVLDGKTNNVGQVTLLAGASKTPVRDRRVSESSALTFAPQTANAAAEQAAGTMYVSSINTRQGTFTISHASNAQTDRTFRYAIIG